MVWSNDLAKLKQDLKAKDASGDGSTAPQPPPRQAPAQTAPKPLEEEDALFMTAVGKSISHPAAQRNIEEHGAEEEFTKAMSQLKGVRPSDPRAQASKNEVGHADHANSAHGAPHPAPRPPDDFEGFEDFADIGQAKGEKRNKGDKARPEEFHLAAGMVIEVDGQLDLRNHNEADARERLAERVLDGQCLGWRSLHVILGNSDALRQVLRDYLDSPQSSPLAKYAQAPVPMGGNKAWILYYHLHPTS
ncbi:MAG: hypothetical protein LBC63_09925 [Holophagales bacterium]|jgi:hypothetical protein|nr:hypothetical protein [Holophagales bacterium]